MNQKVEILIEEIDRELKDWYVLSQEAQVRTMLREYGNIPIFKNGKIRYDVPALDFDYSIYQDTIIRRLGRMEMTGKLTEDELSYIKENTGLK